MVAKMTEVGLGDPIYIGREEQRMPRIICSCCGRKFWTIPSIDYGVCPKCQRETQNENVHSVR
jgi:uncharacterized OB-fold protein